MSLLSRLTTTTRRLTTTARLALSAPPNLTPGEHHVFAKLDAAFEPSRMEVQDVSGGCGSMYAIEIWSGKFAGMSSVKQHRMVNEVLKDEIKEWHGVRLRTGVEAGE